MRQLKETMQMAKAYWVATYRSISDADKLAAYAKLAPPAIAPFGGAAFHDNRVWVQRAGP